MSAVQGGELLAAIVLEDRRSTAIRFVRPLDTLPVVFTATMTHCAPVVDTTYTAMPQEHTVTFRNAAVADTTVDFLLVNLCDDTLYDVAVQLLCDDTTQALFDAPTQHADTLLPHAELPMHTAISVLQWEQRWSGELYAYSITGNVECSPLHLHGRLDGVPPSLTISVLDADTAEQPHIWPNSGNRRQAHNPELRIHCWFHHPRHRQPSAHRSVHRPRELSSQLRHMAHCWPTGRRLRERIREPSMGHQLAASLDCRHRRAP